jgi:hypothetical protein
LARFVFFFSPHGKPRGEERIGASSLVTVTKFVPVASGARVVIGRPHGEAVTFEERIDAHRFGASPVFVPVARGVVRWRE